MTLTLLSTDDPLYDKDIVVSSVKSSLINFNSSATTDLLAVNTYVFKDTEVLAADMVVEYKHRKNTDVLNLYSAVPTNIVNTTTDDFSSNIGQPAIGFTAEAASIYDSNLQKTIDGAITFNSSTWYIDLCNIPSFTVGGEVSISTYNKIKYFDSVLLFTIPAVDSISSLLQHANSDIPIVGELIDLTQFKKVELSGTVSNGDYTLLVLHPDLTKILHKSDIVEGSFTALTQVDTDELVVVAISKSDGQSYAFKSIDITGAPKI